MGIAFEASDTSSSAPPSAARASLRLPSSMRAELRARIELGSLKLARAAEGGADELVSLASKAIPIFERLEDRRRSEERRVGKESISVLSRYYWRNTSRM